MPDLTALQPFSFWPSARDRNKIKHFSRCTNAFTCSGSVFLSCSASTFGRFHWSFSTIKASAPLSFSCEHSHYWQRACDDISPARSQGHCRDHLSARRRLIKTSAATRNRAVFTLFWHKTGARVAGFSIWCVFYGLEMCWNHCLLTDIKCDVSYVYLYLLIRSSFWQNGHCD